jgi:hypothetical protein
MLASTSITAVMLSISAGRSTTDGVDIALPPLGFARVPPTPDPDGCGSLITSLGSLCRERVDQRGRVSDRRKQQLENKQRRVMV